MSNRWPDRYVVGLTGNIATGKSAVLKMAAEKGALALDADKIVHQLLDGDHSVQEAVVSQFGEKARLDDGRIDRDAIANIVFKDAKSLYELEKIIHPAVQNRIYTEIQASNEEIIFVEAIKLLEGDLASICQEIWVTRCPEQLQIDRLVNFRKMDRETAENRINAQSSQSKKVAMADVVIDTAGSLSNTRGRFELAWIGLIERVMRYLEGLSRYNNSSTERAVASADLGPDYAPKPISQHEFEADDWPFVPNIEYSGIKIRRAQISDADHLATFINKATKENIVVTGSDVIDFLRDHGYLIAIEDRKPRAIVGWWTENLVAIIDRILVDNLDKAHEFGGSLLQEIVQTANELICDLILAYLKTDDPLEYHELYTAWGFKYVAPESLPQAWTPQAKSKIENGHLLMLKTLRKTPLPNIRYLSMEEARAHS